MKSSRALVSVAAVLALLLAGCTQAETHTDVEAEETASVCPGESGEGLGDVIPLAEVTDEFGTYCRTTISPDSPALTYSPEFVVLDTVAEFGFTEEDIEERIPSAAQYFSQEMIDSSILDSINDETFALWLEETRDYFIESWEPEYDGEEFTPVYSGNLPTLVRDGSARLQNVDIRFNGARGVEDLSGIPTLIVYFYAEVEYRTTDEGAIEFLMSSSGMTREDALAEYEFLADSSGVSLIKVVFESGMGYHAGEDGIIGTVSAPEADTSVYPG